MPVAGTPVSVTGDEAGGATVAVDPTTGVVVSTRACSERARVDVESRVTIVSDEQVAAATPNRAAELAAMSRAPDDLPPALRQRAQAWAAEADTYGGELLAIRDHLLGVAYADSDATPPGHSYAALVRMFEGETEERTGYAEQFASAFVLMARERQVPARVAVGYLLPEVGVDGTYTVTEAQAHAWPEVNLTGLGWVAIEPTDLSKIGAADDEAAEEPPGGPGESPEKRAAPAPAAEGAAAGTGQEGAGVAGLAGRAAAGGALLLALAVFTVLVGPPVTKRWRRARRRRAHRPVRRVTGAWDEAADRLLEFGLVLAPSCTPDEAVRAAAGRFPPPVVDGLDPLATLVSATLYARRLPTTPRPGRPGDTSRWCGAPCGVRRACAPRLRALVDPRPLWRRRPRPSARRGGMARARPDRL